MVSINKKISEIMFSVMGHKEIKKISVAKIVTPELYDKEGYPVDGGLMDVRLGVIDPGLRCKTCAERLKDCIGHFGHVELARPVIHIMHVKKIFEVLSCTCKECQRVLLSDEEINENFELLTKIKKENGIDAYRKKVKALISDIKKSKKCQHCNKKHLKFKLEKPLNYYENDKRITPIDIRTRFEKIPDKDIFLLGLDAEFSRPEWLILTLFLIPPVTMRPSITLESGERSEDDLTHKLGDIIRINQRLFENINAGAPEIIVEDLWDLLQYHITTYFDNTQAQIPPARHRSGQPLKTIVERIKSKEGRFRHNLAGKRVNFAARTVISPDAMIALNEVGIPKEVAMELTIPEKVTEWNIKWLIELIKSGSKKYPGANYVVTPEGKKKKITDETTEVLLEELETGYMVERHLHNGDVCIFNRQPSLHRMSLMCHRVRVLPGKSFRLNPTVCNPYNADFDGDEMNLHIPQTEEARAEAEILMEVQTQIITPKNGFNVIGCVEDAITGNFLLSYDKEIQKDAAVQLLMSIGIKDTAKLKSLKSKVSGKEIFSVLLPDDFNFIGYSKGHSSEEHLKVGDPGYVVVKNGKLISGIIDSASIGEGNGQLLRALHRQYGEDKTLEVMRYIFRLGIAILLKKGFTTSISDTDIPEEISNKIEKHIRDTNREINNKIEEYNSGKMDILPGKTPEETIELTILELLNKVRNKIGDIIADNATDINPTLIMAKSGARGNLLHLAQMAACVGQQALRGKRIHKGYKRRTLPIFKKDELSSESHGFVGVGFKQGLSPAEFFFHAMTGRDSLMDTALRTPKSGYLYRRLSNALQDLKVEYDNTVRGANGHIIQFLYGEDGIDISKSYGGTINIKKIIKDIVGE